MKFDKFMELVTVKVREIVGKDTSVQIQEVRKNNNVLLHGMTILRKGQNVSPTIYLDSFFEMLEEGMELEHIVRRILEVYVRGLPRGNVDMEFFRDFEKVRDRIVYRLVNRNRNKALLEDVPHVDFLDLAICFYYSYEHPELGAGMIQIHNTHMEMWGTCHRELMQLAERNTPRIMPAQLCGMDSALKEVLEEEALGDLRQLQRETGKYMYVLSNERHCQGAAAVLYPGTLAEAAERLGGSFYILPSSIHEVILLQDGGKENGDSLHEMIADINRNQVREEEVLSDYPYRYEAVTGKVMEVL